METPQTLGWDPKGCTLGGRVNQKRTGKAGFQRAQPPTVQVCPPGMDSQQHEDSSAVGDGITQSLVVPTVFTHGA